MQTIEILYQVFRAPSQLACTETGLILASALQPREVCSEEEPPGWDKRKDVLTIDELLGSYSPAATTITIFAKGIEFAAQQLGLNRNCIEQIVRIHEWGHAVFHVGVNSGESIELAKASINGDQGTVQEIQTELTRTYSSVSSYVHEKIAQTITWLAIQQTHKHANAEGAKQGAAALLDTFEQLTTRQPMQYQLDRVRHLDPDQLQRRIRDFITLIRAGDIRGNQRTWDSIMAW